MGKMRNRPQSVGEHCWYTVGYSTDMITLSV